MRELTVLTNKLLTLWACLAIISQYLNSYHEFHANLLNFDPPNITQNIKQKHYHCSSCKALSPWGQLVTSPITKGWGTHCCISENKTTRCSSYSS